MADISNKKVAVLVDDYFEEAEFTEPIKALKEAGAKVDVVATQDGQLHSLNHANPSKTYKSDRLIDDAKIDDYDALVLPGGAINADHLRMNDKARLWIKKFMDANKPVAAICHAPWALISAGVASGHRLTSYFTIQDDLRNAGAKWSDDEVVIDNNLITSRNPDDIPAFNKSLLKKLQTS